VSQARSAQTAKSPGSESITPQQSSEFPVPVTSIHKIEADGVRVFYRAAGDPDSPVVLLLHGFPTSSFMFRELIPRLATDYLVIAPDLPGFGFTEVPAERKYVYSFGPIGRDAQCVHTSAQNQALCNVCVRLWRTNRIPSGDGSPRPSHSSRFTERECL
jgi:hypothetical protein